MDIQEKITFLIFLGDLFDRIKPRDYAALEDIQEKLEDWVQEAIDTFVIENSLED